MLALVEATDPEVDSAATASDEASSRLFNEVMLYESALGFRFKRTKEDHLQLVFRGCDPANQDSLCVCTLHQESPPTETASEAESNRGAPVKLINCKPHISDIDRLIAFFNKQQSIGGEGAELRNLVIVLRSRFVGLFSKSSSRRGKWTNWWWFTYVFFVNYFLRIFFTSSFFGGFWGSEMVILCIL